MILLTTQPVVCIELDCMEQNLPKPKKTMLRLAILLVISIYLFLTGSFLLKNASVITEYVEDGAQQKLNQLNQNQKTIVSSTLKEVSGYKFYIAKIVPNGTEKEIQDIKNSGLPTELVTELATDLLNIDLDKYAQYLGQRLATFQYPKQASNNLIFVFVNIKPNSLGEYNLKLPDGNLIRLNNFYDYDGRYTSSYGFGVITLKTSFMLPDTTLAHELGHHLDSFLTTADKIQYYDLRKIAQETPWRITDGSKWILSPAEDFAEVYKYTLAPTKEDGLDWRIKTVYGKLVPVSVFSDEDPCLKIPVVEDLVKELSNILHNTDPETPNKSSDNLELQKCRKDIAVGVNSNLYTSIVNQKTKIFIKNFLSRLR